MGKYYIDFSTDSETYAKAIAQACVLANNNDDIKRITLVTPVQNTGFFDDIFSATEIKALGSGGLSINGCPVKLTSASNRSYTSTNSLSEVVVTFGLDATAVLLLEQGSSSIIDIIATHPSGSSLRKWVQTWNPTNIQTQQPTLSASGKPSCPVQKALQQLSSTVNTTSNVFGTTDQDSAKTYARALHHCEPSPIDPVDVFAYLRGTLKWRVGNAEFVEQLFDKLNKHQTFKGGKRTGMRERYNKWLAQCP